MRTRFGLENLKGPDHSEGIGVYIKIDLTENRTNNVDWVHLV